MKVQEIKNHLLVFNIALSSTTTQIYWFINYLMTLELNITVLQTFSILVKHIVIDYHLVWNKLIKGVLKILLVELKHQLVDICTKALASTTFH